MVEQSDTIKAKKWFHTIILWALYPIFFYNGLYSAISHLVEGSIEGTEDEGWASVMSHHQKSSLVFAVETLHLV